MQFPRHILGRRRDGTSRVDLFCSGESEDCASCHNVNSALNQNRRFPLTTGKLAAQNTPPLGGPKVLYLFYGRKNGGRLEVSVCAGRRSERVREGVILITVVEAWRDLVMLRSLMTGGL